MENFEIIDAHVHMAKTLEEEINWRKTPIRPRNNPDTVRKKVARRG